MYTLGDHNRALVKLTSDDGTRTATIELVRCQSGVLCLRSYRDAPDVFLGVKLENDGTFHAFTWTPDGEVAGELACIDLAKVEHQEEAR